jgi:hypothetical protein
MIREMTGYDVVVVGGGPGGFAAAVSAGRAGAKVLLIEREGCLGGGMTTMLVNPFMPFTTSAGPDNNPPARIVNAGIFTELRERLQPFSQEGYRNQQCFDDEAAKFILDQFIQEAGVQVLFHAALYDVQAQAGRVQAVLLAHNGGPIRVAGKVFIDSTGDALLADRAGAEVMFGNEQGAVMPMTLNFMVGGVDMACLPKFTDLQKQAAAGSGDNPPLINTNLSCWSYCRAGNIQFNAIRVTGNTIDPIDLSNAEVDARMRVQNFVAWLRAKVPAFGNCYLLKTGSHIGIRESRRIRGDYMLTNADFTGHAMFDDAIACCSYDIDIHGQAQGQTTIIRLPAGGYYQIPYRCLTPVGLDNLLVASRSISADVAAHSSLRIMPPVMNIGEAAGFAAALSLPAGDVRKIDIKQLQKKIIANGGLIKAQDKSPEMHRWKG